MLSLALCFAQSAREKGYLRFVFRNFHAYSSDFAEISITFFVIFVNTS